MSKKRKIYYHFIRFLSNIFPLTSLKIIYYGRTKQKLDLITPKTFNEKIQWLKFYYFPKNPMVIKCADKFQLYKFLEEKGLQKFSNQLLGVWSKSNEIDFELLPDKFVIKTNNGSSTNIFCLNKIDFDEDLARKKLSQWLKEDFGIYSMEKHYSLMEPKIIAETFLEFSEENIEYNFYCFHGEPKFCKVVSFDNKETKSGKGICMDLSWKKMNFTKKKFELADGLSKPVEYENMIEIARQISSEFPFVRVDFFQCIDRVVLGELTFTPAAGYVTAFTKEAQEIMGQWLDLNLI